jgi:hypothetical protein
MRMIIGNLAASVRSLAMGTTKKRENRVAELRRVRHEAFDALFKARLEGHSKGRGG